MPPPAVLPALDFELLFAALPAPHAVLASDGTVVVLNTALARLLPAEAAATLPGQPLAFLHTAIESAGMVLAAPVAWEAGLTAALNGTPQTLTPIWLATTPQPAPGGYWEASLQAVPATGAARYVLLRLLEVTEQMRSRQAAELEHEQFRFLAENLPQLVWITAGNGEVEYTNQQFINYTGQDVVQLDEAGRTALWDEIIHPDDLPNMYARWGEALASGEPFDIEFRLRGTDGAYRWFLSHVIAQFGAHGQVRRWFGACTDVDAQHRAQLQLEQQQGHMQRILDQLPLTISTMTGPDLTFSFLSAKAKEAMGARAEVGRSVADSLPEVAAQGYVQLLNRVRESGEPHFGTEEPTELIDPATGELHTSYNDYGYVPLRDADGTSVLAYGMDVTAQVLARQRNEALQADARAADQRLRRVTESLPSITFISDQEGQVLYLSPQWYAYTGTTPDDDLNQTWQACVHPADHVRVATEYAAALEAGTPWRYELRLRRHDGQFRWFVSQGVPEPLEEAQAAGRLRQWFGSDLDIHELHETQERLQAKDQQLSQILEQLPAFVATLAGPEHRYSFFNPAYARLVGHRARLGEPVAELLPDLAEQGMAKLLDHVYNTGETQVRQELALRLRNPGQPESLTYLDLTYLALRNERGEVESVLSFSKDVTVRVQARQQAEQLATEMRRRDEQVRALTSSVPVFIFNFDPQGDITYTNPYFYEYTGLSSDGPSNDAWEVLPAPDRHRVGALAQAAMAQGQGWQATFQVRRRDGELRWFTTKAQPYTDAAGQLAGFSAATVEVHELQERTEQLTRSRADFATLADNMAQLAWMADATGYIFWYNQQWYDYTGSDFEAMQGWGWQRVHDPALVEGIKARYEAAIASGEPWEDTFPLRRHDGEMRWFLSRARPIRDAATGAVLRWFGTNTDVTELRELQNRLGESEEELRIQAESIPQQVWTARPDGTVDFYNHRTAAYVGQAMEKDGAAHWLEFVHPDDRAPMQKRWEQAIATQRYYEAEFRLRRYDGEYRWFLGQAQARRAPGGQVMKWYGTNTDVHQQRLLQEQVLASQTRFQQLLETLPQMAWTSRPDGAVSYYNQRWYDFTGGTFEELQDWGWERFIHPDDLPGTLRRWEHSLATGEAFEAEHRWRDLQGQYRWFLARAEAIRDKEGAIAVWVGANTDVHEFKQVQQQLEEQNARLLRTNEDLDNFVYTASHDLKQPINNMAGIFEELTRTAYFRDPDAIKLISYFERALGQIFGTIDDLTAIVRGQRQQQEVPAEAVALAPLAAEIINSLQDQVTQLGATFELDFDTCPTITFVRPNLQSLLYNLLSNSLKYADPKRAPVVRLSCTPDAVSGRPILTVQDNGLGIDMERYGNQLFQLFRRFHTHVEGTGMGLYLVNRIVQIHGGRLEVSSAVGEGTTFRIHL
ncbi:PAS domain-containing sensor histidine kinase [Hymenobacter properus]|uniref:histidine kinase n=1 Tax=Hymenobacter properus TaxID=2791026 RepID=A0A931BHQ3_9BACT|nr:PAS domain-containing protein [Hymenobacter properus]MBF9142568.1 PAS domain-containing protein [Hymenobacter properus]MBR7721375.1 PAS domain-containing protein [Microvirga sp. SRT04]